MMSKTMHIDTPLLEVDGDYSACGRPLLFKMDALQPSGSFKLRGLGLRCIQAAAGGTKGIVCASGGNAGYAAAYAARQLGLAATIIVPTSTSMEARNAIQTFGAEVHVEGSSFDDADAFARKWAADHGAAYLHPFDDPILWEGHASLVDEVVAAGKPFDCVVTAVGGGGLLLGIIEGLKRNGLSDIPIIAVETDGAASLHASIAAGRPITLPAITSVATSLGARRVAQAAFDAGMTDQVISVTVSDSEAVKACLKFADATRVLVEPACGAALAAADVHADLIQRFERPLIEICGGIGTSIARLQTWKETFGL